MREVEYYEGREQTYLKHYVLESYLERLAYNVFSFRDELVYVDGFSGPWRAEDESYEDTSFKIAATLLHKLSVEYPKRGKRVRAVFVEEKPSRYTRLRAAAGQVPFHVDVLNASFEESVAEVRRLVGSCFAFYFVDPTGWTGLALQKLRPLIEDRNSEMLINFMFDYVNRFLEYEMVHESLEQFFGGNVPGIGRGRHREGDILSLYRDRLQSCSDNVLVTSTRIRKPLDDRAYFHLVYATHHVKGLVEFKKVDEALTTEEHAVRGSARRSRDARHGSAQQSLFENLESTGELQSVEPRRSDEAMRIERLCDETLLQNLVSITKYEDIQRLLLQLPEVWNSDVREATMRLVESGCIAIPALTGRRRVPISNDVVVVNDKNA